jgi:MFS family permease
MTVIMLEFFDQLYHTGSMLREQFLGRYPSHFQVNPLVKAFIISESLIWSAWNFVIPIFAIYIVNDIQGGDVETAAMGYSVYLIFRVIFELFCGKFLGKTTDRKKVIVASVGLFLLTLGYVDFILSTTLVHVYVGYALLGTGLGIASPAKNSLFSMHLDKNREAAEWGIADGTQFMCMALAATLGGFIAGYFGFMTLFVISAIVNTVGIIPYALFVFEDR